MCVCIYIYIYIYIYTHYNVLLCNDVSAMYYHMMYRNNQHLPFADIDRL